MRKEENYMLYFNHRKMQIMSAINYSTTWHSTIWTSKLFSTCTHPKIPISLSLQHSTGWPLLLPLAWKELEPMPKIVVIANFILYTWMLPCPVYSTLSSPWTSAQNYAKIHWLLPAITVQSAISVSINSMITWVHSGHANWQPAFLPLYALLALGLGSWITLVMNFNFLLELYYYIAIMNT